MIELMLIKGWYMLYPNNPNSASYSTNYFEQGVHSQPEDSPHFYPDTIKGRDRRFTVPLMPNLPQNLPQNLSFIDTPFINLFHQVSTEESLMLEKNRCQELFKFYGCNE